MLDILYLGVCISENKIEMVKDNVSANLKEINNQTKNGNTLLIFAAYYNNIEIIKFLLENGADKTIKNRQHDTAESIARNFGNFESVEILMEN